AKAAISGKSCEQKREFIIAFFEQIDISKAYATFDVSLMSEWLNDILVQFPEHKEKTQHLLAHTFGLLDAMLAHKLIDPQAKGLYSLAYLGKTVFGDDSLAKSTIYSDILATALFNKMEDTLWGNDSPDIETLKTYLDMKAKVLNY
ncbi:MAG: hypothetical protein KAH25_06440, partial [Bacteroidales bacterium]|nr:hypothetical protein [Bacteroidales bacterium]